MLYVGISGDAIRRQRSHLKKAAWAAALYEIVIEPFATREEAIEAEKIAIESEHPKFNVANNYHRFLKKAFNETELEKEEPQLPDGWLSYEDLRRLGISLSRRWFKRQIAAGKFPAPVKIDGCDAFSDKEIDEWMEARKNDRVQYKGAK